MFRRCNGLASLDVNNFNTSNVERMDYMFSGCNGLISLDISNFNTTNVKNMDDMFSSCSNLYSLDISNLNTDNLSSSENLLSESPSIAKVYCKTKNVPTLSNKAFYFSNVKNATLYVSAGQTKWFKAESPWDEFGNIWGPQFDLIYLLDGDVYKTIKTEEGRLIYPESAPTKEGYTFSGWSEIPETMPDHDVTVTGTFTINKYKITYIVDGVEYKSFEIEYNSAITPEAEPTKDGYKFSGWSEIPETMPAHNVTITGSFERRYDVGNVTSLISFILRGNGGSDDLAIYDKNGNGVLDIGDLILIVRKVLDNTRRSAITRADINPLTPDLTRYSAAQFVLNAPENVREQDIRLAGGIEQTHQIMCKQIAPGAYAVVVYSLTNSLITPVDGGIIEVNDGNAHSGDLYIQDVVLAKPTGETKRFDNMPVSTKISDVEKENGHRQVYDLKGQKQNRTDGLQKGVYIENGKKIVVR